MIKTKHYENVPSLRMLSQKQPLPPDNSARKRSLSTMTTSQSKKNDVTSFPIGFDQQLLNRSQFDMSSYMPGTTTFIILLRCILPKCRFKDKIT